MPGDTLLGRIRVRLVPPFPKIRRTRESDTRSQSYRCLKFFQKSSVFHSRNTDTAPMLYCRPNDGGKAPVFPSENIGLFLLFSFVFFYTQTQIDAYCQPNDGGHASVFSKQTIQTVRFLYYLLRWFENRYFLMPTVVRKLKLHF